MSTTIITYSKREIENIAKEEVARLIEPYRKVIDDMHIRIIDLERMLKRESKR